jgi:hypothetical protein
VAGKFILWVPSGTKANKATPKKSRHLTCKGKRQRKTDKRNQNRYTPPRVHRYSRENHYC